MAAFDHIVIGSGINGLVAASLLGLKGRKVLVLEREAVAGGCLRSAELHPGFIHDPMAATFVLFLTSPAGAALGPHLAKHGFEYCHTPHPTAVLRPDGSALVLSTDRAANVAALNAAHAGDGDAFAAEVDRLAGDAPFLFSILGQPLWSWGTAKTLFKESRKRGIRGLAGWFGQQLDPMCGWLDSTFAGEDAKVLFAPWALHCGLSVDTAYSGAMGRVIAFALEAAGAPIVKGGAGRAAQAFQSLIEAQGGQIRCGADVEEIQSHNGHVTGVRLAGGEVIAAKSVLASVAPGQLYNRLLKTEALPQERQALKRFRHGRGDFQLHFALDGVPEWHTPGLDQVALIHLAADVDAVSKSSNEAERSMLPVVPTICVGQPSRLDPSRCPAGKSVLWLQIPDAPRQIKGDAAGEIEGTDWDDVREAFADRLQAILAKHIKNFDALVLHRKAYSPKDLERMNINLVGGDPYGGSCAVDQFFLWRPFAHSTNGSGPLKGLLHIGASTHPGPGLGGGSGYNAAKRLGA